MRPLLSLLILSLLFLISACSVNPVTGEKQLMFSSFAEDVKIGQQQYQPALQSQGGAYNLDPELSQYVSSVGMKLAAVSDVPKLPYEFVVLNNSIPNAWALPSGKIAINRGLLLKLENESQLAAVLSHEIVHAAARHGAQRQRDNMLIQIGMAGLGLGLQSNDYRDLIIGGAALGAKLTSAKYSRDHELESDHYGMQYMSKAGYDLQGAVELQEVFVELSKQQKSSWFQGLFASHPPSIERVKANKKFAAAHSGQLGFSGKEQYLKAISYLKSKEPAYQLADEARTAMAKNNLKEALTLITRAKSLEPREALFSSIQGDIFSAQGDMQSALNAHSRSTELNPSQFSYFLKRAQSYAALDQIDYAIDDFEYSMRLLPTSLAALQLGELYGQINNQERAIKYYTQAAEARGNIAKSAETKLALLEIESRPEKYLTAKHLQDPKGPLLVTIENQSPLKIASVDLRTILLNAKGKVIKQHDWKTSEAIPALQRSRYYPARVTYHLKPGEQVKTIIKAVTPERRPH